MQRILSGFLDSFLRICGYRRVTIVVSFLEVLRISRALPIRHTRNTNAARCCVAECAWPVGFCLLLLVFCRNVLFSLRLANRTCRMFTGELHLDLTAVVPYYKCKYSVVGLLDVLVVGWFCRNKYIFSFRYCSRFCCAFCQWGENWGEAPPDASYKGGFFRIQVRSSFFFVICIGFEICWPANLLGINLLCFCVCPSCWCCLAKCLQKMTNLSPDVVRFCFAVSQS